MIYLKDRWLGKARECFICKEKGFKLKLRDVYSVCYVLGFWTIVVSNLFDYRYHHCVTTYTCIIVSIALRCYPNSLTLYDE